MTTRPQVSIVMTVYNAGALVERALENMFEIDYPSFEAVVVDDGSTDDTLARVQAISRREPRIVVVEAGRVGRAKALNLGVQTGRGDFIAIQDVDDLSCSHRLTVTAGYLEAHPEVAMVFTGVHMTHDPDVGTAGNCVPVVGVPAGRNLSPMSLYRQNSIIHSSVAFRKSAWRACGGYDENLKLCIDYSFYMRVLAHGPIHGLAPQCVVHYLNPDSWFKARSVGEYEDAMSRIRAEARGSLSLPLTARFADVLNFVRRLRNRFRQG